MKKVLAVKSGSGYTLPMPDTYPATPEEYEEYRSVMGASLDDAEEYRSVMEAMADDAEASAPDPMPEDFK